MRGMKTPTSYDLVKAAAAFAATAAAHAATYADEAAAMYERAKAGQ